MKTEDEYKDNTGKEPLELYPKGSEGYEQWSYSGRPKEKQRLLHELGVEADRDERQESLF